MEHLGGVNAVTEEGWLSISVEDARRLRADMIVVLAPGEVGEVSAGDLARGGEADVIVVRHADALLPTTSVVAVVEEIRRSIGRGARP